jgi:arsenate reductase
MKAAWYAQPMGLFDEVTLLHNPRCSKSRAAKALLDDTKIAYRERRYLDEPLSAAELAELRRRLGRPAREWVRTGETAFRDAGLTPDAGDDEILAAMARFPILIERPILIVRGRAVIGRPVERIAELVESDHGR